MKQQQLKKNNNNKNHYLDLKFYHLQNSLRVSVYSFGTDKNLLRGGSHSYVLLKCNMGVVRVFETQTCEFFQFQLLPNNSTKLQNNKIP